MSTFGLYLFFFLTYVHFDGETTCPCQWQESETLTAPVPRAGESFGVAMAAEGMDLVIGAPYEGGGGSAYVFRFDGTLWLPVQTLKPPPPYDDPYSEFGSAVAISGNLIVVGAYAENTKTGAAYVYRYDGAQWQDDGRLTEALPTNSEYAWSVAVHDDIIAVGARFANNNEGRAYVYEYSGGWYRLAELSEVDTEDSEDNFGLSIALSTDYLVVGAPGAFHPMDGGVVYIYHRNYTGWENDEPERIVARDRATYHHRFGQSVAAKGQRIVVGTQSGVSGIGAAYSFSFEGTGWREKRLSPTPTDSAFSKTNPQPDYFGWSQPDYFGWSVALDDDIIVVGAHNDFGGEGSAYAYVWDGIHWIEHQLRPGAGEESDSLGYSVAVTGDQILAGNNTKLGQGTLTNSGNAGKWNAPLASFGLYGNGTPGLDGDIPSFTPTNCAAIGHSLLLKVSNSWSRDTLGIMLVGSSGMTKTWQDVHVHVSNPLMFSFLLPEGGTTISTHIPNDPTLNGAHLYMQVLEANPNNNFDLESGGRRIAASRGLRLTLGKGIPFP